MRACPPAPRALEHTARPGWSHPQSVLTHIRLATHLTDVCNSACRALDIEVLTLVKSLHIGQVIVSTWLIVILRVVDTSYLREDRLYTVRYRDYRYRGRPFSARCCPAPPEETSRAGPPGGIYLSIIIILHRYRAQCEVSSDARKFNVFRMSPHPADVTLTLSQNVRSRAPQDPARPAPAPRAMGSQLTLQARRAPLTGRCLVHVVVSDDAESKKRGLYM